ncbi:hypothetical protein LTR56_000448 [Elasticomyces elasticus]|nr:hypothetical protein LTR56_000448 [Elasticomyces elasticus]KAK4922836.1 hypothetical protein LTR49_009843 [Elasticomyces elasticus]KAK5759787.1 hypothetical protein LTS12_010127 [Elasticomyces elasticus]
MADHPRKLAVPRKSSVETSQPQQGWNNEYQAKSDRIDQDTQLLREAKKHPDPEFLFNLLEYLDWPLPKPEEFDGSFQHTFDCAFVDGDLSEAIDMAMSLQNKFRELETDRLLRVRKGILAYAVASTAAMK